MKNVLVLLIRFDKMNKSINKRGIYDTSTKKAKAR